MRLIPLTDLSQALRKRTTGKVSKVLLILKIALLRYMSILDDKRKAKLHEEVKLFDPPNFIYVFILKDFTFYLCFYCCIQNYDSVQKGKESCPSTAIKYARKQQMLYFIYTLNKPIIYSIMNKSISLLPNTDIASFSDFFFLHSICSVL